MGEAFYFSHTESKRLSHHITWADRGEKETEKETKLPREADGLREGSSLCTAPVYALYVAPVRFFPDKLEAVRFQDCGRRRYALALVGCDHILGNILFRCWVSGTSFLFFLKFVKKRNTFLRFHQIFTCKRGLFYHH